MKKAEFLTDLINVSPAYLAGGREHFSDIEYQPRINYKNVSRYGYLRTIQDDNGNIYHESWYQKVVDISPDDQYMIVTKEEENRLDIIAQKYYNTARYWWVVALANYIIDPFSVPSGTRLRIPSLLSLYKKGGVLGG